MGHDWWTSNNGASGVDFREFHPQVTILRSLDNAGHGVSVRDSSNVELSYVLTSGNGIGSSLPETGAGLYFHEANDDERRKECLLLHMYFKWRSAWDSR